MNDCPENEIGNYMKLIINGLKPNEESPIAATKKEDYIPAIKALTGNQDYTNKKIEDCKKDLLNALTEKCGNIFEKITYPMIIDINFLNKEIKNNTKCEDVRSVLLKYLKNDKNKLDKNILEQNIETYKKTVEFLKSSVRTIQISEFNNLFSNYYTHILKKISDTNLLTDLKSCKRKEPYFTIMYIFLHAYTIAYPTENTNNALVNIIKSDDTKIQETELIETFINPKKIKPDARQYIAANRFSKFKETDDKAYFLFHGVGTGKTITSLCIALSYLTDANLAANNNPLKVLIIAPSGIFRASFISDAKDMNIYTYNITVSTSENESSVIETCDALLKKDDNSNYALKFTGFDYDSLYKNGGIDQLTEDYDVLICDEAHRLLTNVLQPVEEFQQYQINEKGGIDLESRTPFSATVPTGEADAVPTGEADVVPTGEEAVVPTGEVDVGPTGEADAVPTGEVDAVPTGEADVVPTGEEAVVPTGEEAVVPTGEDNEEVEEEDNKNIIDNDSSPRFNLGGGGDELQSAMDYLLTSENYDLQEEQYNSQKGGEGSGFNTFARNTINDYRFFDFLQKKIKNQCIFLTGTPYQKSTEDMIDIAWFLNTINKSNQKSFIADVMKYGGSNGIFKPYQVLTDSATKAKDMSLYFHANVNSILLFISRGKQQFKGGNNDQSITTDITEQNKILNLFSSDEQKLIFVDNKIQYNELLLTILEKGETFLSNNLTDPNMEPLIPSLYIHLTANLFVLITLDSFDNAEITELVGGDGGTLSFLDVIRLLTNEFKVQISKMFDQLKEEGGFGQFKFDSMIIVNITKTISANISKIPGLALLLAKLPINLTFITANCIGSLIDTVRIIFYKDNKTNVDMLVKHTAPYISVYNYDFNDFAIDTNEFYIDLENNDYDTNLLVNSLGNKNAFPLKNIENIMVPFTLSQIKKLDSELNQNIINTNIVNNIGCGVITYDPKEVIKNYQTVTYSDLNKMYKESGLTTKTQLTNDLEVDINNNLEIVKSNNDTQSQILPINISNNLEKKIKEINTNGLDKNLVNLINKLKENITEIEGFDVFKNISINDTSRFENILTLLKITRCGVNYHKYDYFLHPHYIKKSVTADAAADVDEILYYLPLIYPSTEEIMYSFCQYLTSNNYKFIWMCNKFEKDVLDLNYNFGRVMACPIAKFNATNDKPICIIISPDHTEGFSFTFNPSIFCPALCNSAGDAEQVYGRVLRKYNIAATKGRYNKKVYQYFGASKEEIGNLYFTAELYGTDDKNIFRSVYQNGKPYIKSGLPEDITKLLKTGNSIFNIERGIIPILSEEGQQYASELAITPIARRPIGKYEEIGTPIVREEIKTERTNFITNYLFPILSEEFQLRTLQFVNDTSSKYFKLMTKNENNSKLQKNLVDNYKIPKGLDIVKSNYFLPMDLIFINKTQSDKKYCKLNNINSIVCLLGQQENIINENDQAQPDVNFDKELKKLMEIYNNKNNPERKYINKKLETLFELPNTGASIISRAKAVKEYPIIIENQLLSKQLFTDLHLKWMTYKKKIDTIKKNIIKKSQALVDWGDRDATELEPDVQNKLNKFYDLDYNPFPYFSKYDPTNVYGDTEQGVYGYGGNLHGKTIKHKYNRKYSKTIKHHKMKINKTKINHNNNKKNIKTKKK
jgi:hypothetical protein